MAGPDGHGSFKCNGIIAGTVRKIANANRALDAFMDTALFAIALLYGGVKLKE